MLDRKAGFGGPSPTYVDVLHVAGSLDPEKDPDTKSQIKVAVDEVPLDTAEDFPMRCEGNLRPPPGGQGQPPYWRAKVARCALDIDIDSDNNNRYRDPDRNDAEDRIEGDAPGKYIMQNVDDDDEDGTPDKDDEIINGEEDEAHDMVRVVVEIQPPEDVTRYNVELDVSNGGEGSDAGYDRIRIFRPDGTAVIGPQNREPYRIREADLTEGKGTFLAEGVKGDIEVGRVDIMVKAKGENGQVMAEDRVVARVTDTLALPGAFPMGFPFLRQFKDTAMLCIHGCTLAGLPGLPKHRWDVSHEAYSGECPHCRFYCGPTSVKMINQYLAGNLSRDRIMFEVAPGRMHGLGWLLRTERLALAWATNLDLTAVEYHDTFLFDSPWSLISDAIVKGIPVIMVVRTGPGETHAVAVCGARIVDGKEEIHVCNPSFIFRTWQKADEFEVVAISYVSNNKWEGAAGRMQEASYAEDADEGTGDGVIRFDEEQRFHDDQPDPLGLDPSRRDSDNDGVLDKDEVRIKYGVQ